MHRRGERKEASSPSVAAAGHPGGRSRGPRVGPGPPLPGSAGDRREFAAENRFAESRAADPG